MSVDSAAPVVARLDLETVAAADEVEPQVLRARVANGVRDDLLRASEEHLGGRGRGVGQRFFAQNFLEISDKMLAGGRLPNGAAQIKKHQALFAREEKEFGVPASVITAFWGLESDFGAGQATRCGFRPNCQLRRRFGRG